MDLSSLSLAKNHLVEELQMEPLRKLLVFFRIIIVIMITAFFALIFLGARGESMVFTGMSLIATLLMTHYLSKLYDLYKQSTAAKEEDAEEKEPQRIDSWGFDPLSYAKKDVDEYLQDLLSFITLRRGKDYIPSKDQDFKIWWEDTATQEQFATGKVTKMHITDDEQILFETTTGNYLGEPEDCIDLIITKKVCKDDNHSQ